MWTVLEGSLVTEDGSRQYERSPDVESGTDPANGERATCTLTRLTTGLDESCRRGSFFLRGSCVPIGSSPCADSI